MLEIRTCWSRIRPIWLTIGLVVAMPFGCKQETMTQESATGEVAETSTPQEPAHLGFDSTQAAVEAFVAAAETDDASALGRARK